MQERLTKEKIRRLLFYALYMFLALTTQEIVLAGVKIGGVCAMVLPAVAVAVGMFEGATFGSVFSLIMGIFADMIFVENTVTFTILFPMLAFAAGFVSQFYINRSFFAYMVAALGGLLIAAGVQMLRTLAISGWSFELVMTAVMQAILSLPIAVLAYFPPAKWIQ